MKTVLEIIYNILIWIRTFILEKMLAEAIFSSPIGKSIKKRQQMVELINPEKFKAEHVASVFNIPTFLGTFLCFIATRQGHFIKTTSRSSKEQFYSLVNKESK